LIRITLFAVCALAASSCFPSDSMSAPVITPQCVGSVPGTMRVASYNIASGAKSSLDEIGKVIEQISPDILALQEVNDGALSGGGQYQAKVLADRLGYQFIYAATLSRAGIGTYGISLLSRYPLTDVNRIDMRVPWAAEARTAIDATVCAGEKRIRIVATHTDVWQPQACIDILAKHFDAHVSTPTVLLGDLNEQPTEAGPVELESHGLTDLIGRLAEGPTFWADNKRIDYVMADDTLTRLATGAGIGQEKASDHLPVWVDFNLANLQ
jgi:endonuclease/exonuclease/phosphatase family metal-dependent hydrolase